MPLNITINPDDSHDSEHSSISDEEDSSGVDVSPPSVTGSQGYQDYDVEGWHHLHYPDELTSDSAPPRSSRHNRNTIHTSRSRSGRRSFRRDGEREAFSQRQRRHQAESPDSVDSVEDFVPNYGRQQPDKRYWSSVAQGGVNGYAQSSSSGGPSYNVLHQGGVGHLPFSHSGLVHPPSDQLVRFGHPGHMGRSGQFMNAQGYGYGYGSHYPPPHSAGMPGVFSHDQHPGHPNHLPHHHAPESRNRSRGQSPPEPPLPHMMPPQSNPHYGSPPFVPPDLVPYSPNGYFPYNQIPGGMLSHQLFGQLPQKPESPSATSQSDTAKDDAIARLEKLILDERADREARDAAREAAMAKAAADKLAAEERAAAEKKIADEAAAKATAAANAEAEKKAAEEAIKAQKMAEEMAAAAAAEAKKTAEEAAAAAAAEAKKAADEAAAAAVAEAKKAAEEAAANKPPPEKKKPIKFKDAVGRKFNFPFHLCSTWQGMEELIRQAFLHVEVIGPHVAEGHYDLVGPSGDIILPQVWETVIEPDWTITMHMWPIPEKPKDQPPPPPDDNAIVVVEEAKKKSDAAAPGPKKPRPGNPGSFAMWMMGNNRPKPNKPLKVEKKPEIVQHHGDTCGVM